jgi:TolA-binding protein
VADAERRGLPRVLASADDEDLATLADAARFIGKDELARRALLAERRRFSGSVRAAEAAFLLGRLEEGSDGGATRALAWYDRYLKEAPNGRYVSEALGRKMTALQKSDRAPEALAIASDYLRRFPTGSYAHAAAALVERARSSAGAPLRAP